MAKDDKNFLFVAQEIKLVKILAGNNKTLRERTIKRLSKWLSGRTKYNSISEDAFMRIWKGLFYALWMADKPLIQEDCAEKISHLIHLGDIKASLLFFKCFLQTMVNEWFGIDQHRIDKFLMLIRRVFRQMFTVLHTANYPETEIKEFCEILNQTALKITQNTALGLSFHINDIYLEELAKVSGGNISPNTVLALIQPFAQQMIRVDDFRQINHIIENVFNYLMKQSDVGIEYQEKFHAWRRQGFPGGSLDALESVPVEEDDFEDGDENLIKNEVTNLPKDPRAGKVDVVLPQLLFDAVSIINFLEEIKFKKYATLVGKKAVENLIRTFRIFSEGTFPLGVKRIEINVNTKPLKLKKAVKRLQDFEKSLKPQSQKAKAKMLRQKKVAEALNQQVKKILEEEKKTENLSKKNKQLSQNKNKPKQLKKDKTQSLDEFIKKSEGHLFEVNKDELKHLNKNKPKLLKKDKTQSLDKFIKKTKSVDEVEKKNDEHLLVKNKKETRKRKMDKNVDNNSKKTKKECLYPVKCQNKFVRNSGLWVVDEFEIPDSPKPETNDCEWSKPLQNGETEFFVMSKMTKNKIKQLSKSAKRQIVDNISNKQSTIVKNPFSGEKTPTREKKIKFSNKIEAQDFQAHQKQVLKSPIIPYDAKKKPAKSLLKNSPFSSPINPFYKNTH